MKILVLNSDFPPSSYGGAGIVAFRLAKELQELGQEVTILTATLEPKKDLQPEQFDGLEVWRIYANFHERWKAYLGLYNPQVIGPLKKILEQAKPDIVLAHNLDFRLSYQCLKISKKTGAKVFLVAHDVQLFNYGKLINFPILDKLAVPQKFSYKVSWLGRLRQAKKRYNPFRNLIIRYYLHYVDKIICVSWALKQALSDNGIKNTVVIHNGINQNDWNLNAESLIRFKKKFNLQNRQVIFFGGRLSGAKGAELLVRTMPEIIKKNPKAVLLIAGKINDYTEKLLRIASDLKISQNIIFVGWLDFEEMKLAYFSADVCVTPSFCFDSFPTANLEAMAASRPVIATCFGGSSEQIIQGKTGFIINPYSPAMLIEKINTLLSNQKMAEEMGQLGREYLEKEFSIKKMGQNYLDLFKRFY